MADAFEQRALLAAESLLIDHWTAEVVSRLHAIGVQPLLLKGPATARWLYADDPAARDYADIDLLVAPDSYGATEAVLEGLGYTRPEGFWLEGDLRPHDAE